MVVQGSLSAALGALAGNTKAAAALVAAINTVVASNLSNAAVLATLTALIQQIIIQNAPSTIGTGQTTTLVLQVTENPNQTQAILTERRSAKLCLERRCREAGGRRLFAVSAWTRLAQHRAVPYDRAWLPSRLALRSSFRPC